MKGSLSMRLLLSVERLGRGNAYFQAISLGRRDLGHLDFGPERFAQGRLHIQPSERKRGRIGAERAQCQGHGGAEK
jgi:hypothetical protein